MKKIIAIVPVRAGSKGLPDKNIRNFCGSPLFYRAAQQGVLFADRCIVTTDIKPILDRRFSLPRGTELHSRPPELSTDQAQMDSVLLEVLSKAEFSGAIVILLQATSPLRSIQDIKACLDLFNVNSNSIVFTVTKSDPSVLKNGFLVDGVFSSVSDLGYLFRNRQSLPQTYKPNGAVYVFNRDDFIKNNGFSFVSAAAVEMPKERSLDIDSLDDFLSAEIPFLGVN